MKNFTDYCLLILVILVMVGSVWLAYNPLGPSNKTITAECVFGVSTKIYEDYKGARLRVLETKYQILSGGNYYYLPINNCLISEETK